jgi:hypothetical protein
MLILKSILMATVLFLYACGSEKSDNKDPMPKNEDAPETSEKKTVTDATVGITLEIADGTMKDTGLDLVPRKTGS